MFLCVVVETSVSLYSFMPSRSTLSYVICLCVQIFLHAQGFSEWSPLCAYGRTVSITCLLATAYVYYCAGATKDGENVTSPAEKVEQPSVSKSEPRCVFRHLQKAPRPFSFEPRRGCQAAQNDNEESSVSEVNVEQWCMEVFLNATHYIKHKSIDLFIQQLHRAINLASQSHQP